MFSPSAPYGKYGRVVVNNRRRDKHWANTSRVRWGGGTTPFSSFSTVFPPIGPPGMDQKSYQTKYKDQIKSSGDPFGSDPFAANPFARNPFGSTRNSARLNISVRPFDDATPSGNSEQGSSEQGSSEQGKSGQGKSGQRKSGQRNFGQRNFGQGNSDEDSSDVKTAVKED